MVKKILKNLILPLMIIIILVILVLDYKFIFKKIYERNKCAKEYVFFAANNEAPKFKISKIIKYSSAEAIDNTVEQNLQDLSICQYSDIAIYIDNFADDLTEENTVKELYIDNFNVDLEYATGIPTLYYKNPLEISKFRVTESNKINDRIDYEIIYSNEENDEKKYERPVFYTDCSNPIVIGFVNKDIVKDYKVTKENGLVSFDGRIFQNMNINLEELSPKISFTIHLKNNLDEKFICNASANLKLETEEGSVKSGYIIEMDKNIGYYNFFEEN